MPCLVYIYHIYVCVSICRLVEKCPGPENVLQLHYNGNQDAEIGTNYLRAQMLHKRPDNSEFNDDDELEFQTSVINAILNYWKNEVTYQN